MRKCIPAGACALRHAVLYAAACVINVYWILTLTHVPPRRGDTGTARQLPMLVQADRKWFGCDVSTAADPPTGFTLHLQCLPPISTCHRTLSRCGIQERDWHKGPKQIATCGTSRLRHATEAPLSYLVRATGKPVGERTLLCRSCAVALQLSVGWGIEWDWGNPACTGACTEWSARRGPPLTLQPL